MKGNKQNGLCVLEGSTVIGAVAATATDVEKAQLWHKRLAQISERSLQDPERPRLLCVDKLGKLDFCEDCIYGMAARLKLNKSIHITSDTLNYVHSKLGGTSKHKTLGDDRYFMTIIDDFSRNLWVYILKSKDQASQKFKDW